MTIHLYNFPHVDPESRAHGASGAAREGAAAFSGRDPLAAIQQLIDDMFETMREYQGIGLAAPQVHESVRLFVAGVPAEEQRAADDVDDEDDDDEDRQTCR